MESGTNEVESSRQAVSGMRSLVDSELDAINQAGLKLDEYIITSRQGNTIKVAGLERSLINCSAFDYLGLTQHPEVIKAAKEALDTHGVGLASSRVLCGTQDIHKKLEEKIAKFHGKEDAILYNSGFDANLGLFQALLSSEDVVLSDEFNHASIIDGVRLCAAKRMRYKHRDMKDLEAKLKDTQDFRIRLIATHGVFSMDADFAPLKDICDLADTYGAEVFVDDCHATGFVGKTGRGTEEYFGVPGKVDIINSTLSKALGGAGGYTTGPRQVIDLLRTRSRPYIFSLAIPSSLVASASKAFDILMESSDLAERLALNSHRFRKKMTEAGFEITGDEDQAICPVMLGDFKLTTDFTRHLLANGVSAGAIRYPAVPKGKARIRVSLSASHTTADVDRIVDTFIKTGKKLGVIR